MGEHPLKHWLDGRADLIEQVCRSSRLQVSVLGGDITPRQIRFHFSPASALGGLQSMREIIAPVLSVRVEDMRFYRLNGVAALEVPRPDASTLSLVRLQASLRPLPLCTALLGRDEQGYPLLLHLPGPEVGHILVAGAAGAGKTALARGMLTSLAMANDPDDLRFLLVDAKGDDFAVFAGLPHLAGPVLRDGEEVERRLQWLTEEMSWREGAGVRAPAVIVALSEVVALLVERPSLKGLLASLAEEGCPVGIHLVLCTGFPAAPEIAELREILPCRLVGRVTSAREAVLATGLRASEAEHLLGAGDFLLLAGQAVDRFQAAYVATEEILALVEMLQAEAAVPGKDITAAQRGEPDRPLVLGMKDWLKRLVSAAAL